MRYLFNNKELNIPDEEIENLVKNLKITQEEAINIWLCDNEYINNEDIENLTQKAKENGTTKIKARKNVENKKTERNRKENTTKSFIIDFLFQKLAEIGNIYNLKVENKEKIITFSLNNNNYKLDLIQKRAEKPKK